MRACVYMRIYNVCIFICAFPLNVQVVSTNPHPMRVAAGNKMTQCPPREWRFPHVRVSLCLSFICSTV